MTLIFKLYNKIIRFSDRFLIHVLNLSIRLFMAHIFFKSGQLRLNDYLNGQWHNQVTAFSEYHPIPGVPAEIGAFAGTAGEIILPILLAFGIFTRLGAAGLLVMTLTIQFLVPEDYGVSNPDHYMWMLLLAVPMLHGGGVFSADHIARKFLFKKA